MTEQYNRQHRITFRYSMFDEVSEILKTQTQLQTAPKQQRAQKRGLYGQGRGS